MKAFSFLSWITSLRFEGLCDSTCTNCLVAQKRSRRQYVIEIYWIDSQASVALQICILFLISISNSRKNISIISSNIWQNFELDFKPRYPHEPNNEVFNDKYYRNHLKKLKSNKQFLNNTCKSICNLSIDEISLVIIYIMFLHIKKQI